MTLQINNVYCDDALHFTKRLQTYSVQCVVTSPPYFNLRNYGTGDWSGGDPTCDHLAARNKTRFQRGFKAGDKQSTNRGSDGSERVWKDICPTCGARRVDNQLGQEPNMNGYISNLVLLFREIKRVLRPDGTLWLNLGDTYSGGGRGARSKGSSIQATNKGSLRLKRTAGELPAKSLMMIPARVAIALQDDGWLLRSQIVWHKTNVLPESVTDRPTRSHEMIYLFSKSADYYYDIDAVREPHAPSSIPRAMRAVGDEQKFNDDGINSFGAHLSKPRPNTRKKRAPEQAASGSGIEGHSGVYTADGRLLLHPNGRNMRDVWSMPTAQSKEEHYAAFPPELPRKCILAGSAVGDLVFDPFMGSGTTALVARELGRHFIGCDLNQKYVDIANKLLSKHYQTDMFYHGIEEL